MHLIQNWFGYSDPTTEKRCTKRNSLHQFAGLSLERIPDETTVLNFRRLLEKHELAAGILGIINGYVGDRRLCLRQRTIVDATLIHALSSTQNNEGEYDPYMHQTKRGNQYYFCMRAPTSRACYTSVAGTAANGAGVTQVDKLLHGAENLLVCADAGYTGEKREKHARARIYLADRGPA